MLNRSPTLLLACLAGLLLPSTPVRADAFDECDKQPDHHDQTNCQAAVVESLNKDLAALERRVRKAIAQYFAEEGEDIIVHLTDNSLTSFDSAVKQFVLYRDATCSLEASSTGLGNGSGNRRLACEYRLTRQRIALLQSQGKLFGL